MEAKNRKEEHLEQIVNAIEGKDIEETEADTGQNKWLKRIAEAIQNSSGGGGAITKLESLDSANPIILRDLASGVYVAYGYFKPNANVTNMVMAQMPMYMAVARTNSTSYIQLFYAYQNSIQYLEITDTTYTLETVALKTGINKELVLKSSTAGSSKVFNITVDDTGAITATERVA